MRETETKKVFYCQQYCQFLCASGCNNTPVPLTASSPQTHKTSTITGNFYITKAIFFSGLYSEWRRWLKQNVPNFKAVYSTWAWSPNSVCSSSSLFYYGRSLAHRGYKTLCEEVKNRKTDIFSLQRCEDMTTVRRRTRLCFTEHIHPRIRLNSRSVSTQDHTSTAPEMFHIPDHWILAINWLHTTYILLLIYGTWLEKTT